MAMLMTNEVFARTWGERAGPAPAEDYWPTLIGRVKQSHPDLLFMAEAYWDMEWTLQQQGFDLCYDKRLYDRLVHESPDQVRGHLQADRRYQERLIRFIENHDEPRAAATFGPATGAGGGGRHVDAAGRPALPRRSARGPPDPHPGVPEPRHRTSRRTPTCARSTTRLLRAVADQRAARRRLAPLRLRRAGRTTTPHQQLVSWCWSTPASRHLVVVNLSEAPAQARVQLPWSDLADGPGS